MKIFRVYKYLTGGNRDCYDMESTLKPHQHEEFYQHLGRLFYAIAAADGVIRREEVEALKTVVKKEWKNRDSSRDMYGTQTASQIEIVFDWLDANKPEAEEAFKRFAEYYREHKDLFPESIKNDLMSTSNEIASAFRDKNKSELVMLAKLQTLFNH